MNLITFCSSSCALLLLLALSWRTATGLPVRSLSAERCSDCALLFKDLLLNTTELLDNDVLWHGITSDKTMVKSPAETVLACAPTLTQSPGCMMQRNSPFNEGECLRNIMKDLSHYAAVIQSYINLPSLRRPEEEVALLRPTLGIIQSLRKNCSPNSDGETDSSEDTAQMWGDDSFSNRQKMRQMMRGFHVRTITINRAMGYIASGDHRK